MSRMLDVIRDLVRPSKPPKSKVDRDPEVAQSVAASNVVLSRNRTLVSELAALEKELTRRRHD